MSKEQDDNLKIVGVLKEEGVGQEIIDLLIKDEIYDIKAIDIFQVLRALVKNAQTKGEVESRTLATGFTTYKRLYLSPFSGGQADARKIEGEEAATEKVVLWDIWRLCGGKNWKPGQSFAGREILKREPTEKELIKLARAWVDQPMLEALLTNANSNIVWGTVINMLEYSKVFEHERTEMFTATLNSSHLTKKRLIELQRVWGTKKSGAPFAERLGDILSGRDGEIWMTAAEILIEEDEKIKRTLKVAGALKARVKPLEKVPQAALKPFLASAKMEMRQIGIHLVGLMGARKAIGEDEPGNLKKSEATRGVR